eukprot:CAMPEP_0204567872 /NCGR_PEP_ID=MMETSP0661-20131031/36844_1 /ASSEMBLY_ACC=CAM_ASM_000606 /TAXON_ID=109239 /ORGANISM="Alexandrium margalefi, Strain AMGDE01CS-322" /LENGTH=114 /DNA_ID=CAMNT_0051575827 /DNA_START=53 /DNA_END=397 /DNA_ORIENTATION=+
MSEVIRFGEMGVHVKGLRGTTLSLGADPTATVEDLKKWVAQQDGVDSSKLALCTAKGMELAQLDADKKLFELGLQPGSLIFARRRRHAAWGEYATAWQQKPAPFLRPAPALTHE